MAQTAYARLWPVPASWGRAMKRTFPDLPGKCRLPDSIHGSFRVRNALASALTAARHDRSGNRSRQATPVRVRPEPSTRDRASAACRARVRPQDALRAGSPGLLPCRREERGMRRLPPVDEERHDTGREYASRVGQRPAQHCAVWTLPLAGENVSQHDALPCSGVAKRLERGAVRYPRQQARRSQGFQSEQASGRSRRAGRNPARGFPGNAWGPAQPAHCTCPRPRAGRRAWLGFRAMPRSPRCRDRDHPSRKRGGRRGKVWLAMSRHPPCHDRTRYSIRVATISRKRPKAADSFRRSSECASFAPNGATSHETGATSANPTRLT